MAEVYFCGPAYHLPGEPIGNDAIESHFQLDGEWIRMFVGTESRHLAFDFERWQATHTLASLATLAARRSLERAEVDKKQIEFVLLSTATPDQLMPATVNQVADALGLNGIATYQLQCGCVGALQAMQLASLLIRSGAFRCGLVIGADICAKFIRTREQCGKLSASELINYALFGDGAGAVVVASAPQSRAWRLDECRVRFEGQGMAAGQEVNWFAVAQPSTYVLKEDYKAIQARVPQLTADMVDELLLALDMRLDDFRHVLLPQLSKNMSTLIREHLGVPEAQAIQPVDTTGNNGNALPFLQLGMLDQKAAPGDSALAVAVESSKWLVGGLALTRM